MQMIYIDDDLVKEAIHHYGAEPQTRQAMEECAELIQECNKHLRGKGTKQHLAEEIADVIICIKQLMFIYGTSEQDIQDEIDRKQMRLLERIGNKNE